MNGLWRGIRIALAVEFIIAALVVLGVLIARHP